MKLITRSSSPVWTCGYGPSPAGTIVSAPSWQFWSRTHSQSPWPSSRNLNHTWGPSGSQGRDVALLLLSGNLCFILFFLQEWRRIRRFKTCSFRLSHPEWIILFPSVLLFPYLQNGYSVNLSEKKKYFIRVKISITGSRSKCSRNIRNSAFKNL